MKINCVQDEDTQIQYKHRHFFRKALLPYDCFRLRFCTPGKTSPDKLLKPRASGFVDSPFSSIVFLQTVNLRKMLVPFFQSPLLVEMKCGWREWPVLSS